MLKFLTIAAVAAMALPAAARAPNGPTPGEQVSMHTGTTATDGSSTVVTDRNGTHPEGFEGQAPINRISASNGVRPHRHHARRGDAAQRPA